jgi:hypothetical protein
MSVKMPVIEIDLDDSKFKAFAKEFDKYQDALRKAGLGARAAGAAAAAAGAAGAASGAKAANAFERFRNALGDVNKAARDSLPVLGRMAIFAADIAKSMASAAWSAAKWLTFGALAGGFGLGSLANSASTQRRESGQLGLKPGQLKAANLFFDRYLGDTQGVLGNIAAAQADPTKQRIFTSLGINAQGKDPYQLLTELLPKVGAEGKKYGFNPAILEGLGISNVFSQEQVRGLANLPAGELSRTIGQANAAAPGLGLQDNTAQTWQDFMSRMGVAATKIENVFITALTKIAGPLEKFADSLAKVVTTFVENGGLDGLLKGFGDGIKWLSEYLASDSLKNSIKDFASALRDLSETIHAITHPIEALGNTEPVKATDKAWNSLGEWGDSLIYDKETLAERKKGIPTKKHAKLLRDLESTDETLKKNPFILELLQRLEHGTAESPKGAAGAFQLMPKTAAAYGLSLDDRFNYEKAAVVAEQEISKLLRKYKGNVNQALAAYNWGQGNLDADIKANGENWLKHAPRETQDYVARAATVRVEIQNSTGGNAIVSMAAAHGPGS